MTQPRGSLDPHARRPSKTPIFVDLAAGAVTAGLAVAAADTERPVKEGILSYDPIAMGLGLVAAVFAVSGWYGINEYCAANPDARC